MLRSVSAVNMLGLVAAALRGGGIFGRHRKVTVVADVVRATVRPYAPVPYQVDGDYLGDTDHLEFRWEPDTCASSSRGPDLQDSTIFWVPKLLRLASSRFTLWKRCDERTIWRYIRT